MNTDSKSTLQDQQDQLRDDQLEAVSAGWFTVVQKEQENAEQLKALETFGKALQKAGQI
jgi:hypothetical protein